MYAIAMLGVTNHAKVPLQLATLLGFLMSGLSLVMAVAYLIANLLYWHRFTAGVAPVLSVVPFFLSVRLFFIGIIGEYIGAIQAGCRSSPRS